MVVPDADVDVEHVGQGGGLPGRREMRPGDGVSGTAMVMMMAITPSVKASGPSFHRQILRAICHLSHS
jgi:hypothetical protein